MTRTKVLCSVEVWCDVEVIHNPDESSGMGCEVSLCPCPAENSKSCTQYSLRKLSRVIGGRAWKKVCFKSFDGEVMRLGGQEVELMKKVLDDLPSLEKFAIDASILLTNIQAHHLCCGFMKNLSTLGLVYDPQSFPMELLSMLPDIPLTKLKLSPSDPDYQCSFTTDYMTTLLKDVVDRSTNTLVKIKTKKEFLRSLPMRERGEGDCVEGGFVYRPIIYDDSTAPGLAVYKIKKVVSLIAPPDQMYAKLKN